MKLPDRIDVLVVGGGNAGLCAAIAAREAGAEVVLLEHAPIHMRGGNTRHTRNLRAMHTDPTRTLTERYTEDEYWQDLLRVTEGNTREDLARLMITESWSLLSWLEVRGVRFQPALSGTLSLGRTNAFFLGGGKATVNALYRTAETLGVHIFYDTEVTHLNIDTGRFKSAVITNNEETFEINAAAVVVASGGFQANSDWMRQAWGESADNFLIRGTPFNTGTMLRCLMEQGASTTGEATQCHAVAIDARGPKFDGGIVTRLDCVCFSVVVNNTGIRFHDEGEDFWPKRYAIWGRLVARQPDQMAWAIFDSKVAENFMPSVYPPIQADSIHDLAENIDIDSEILATTITGFNDAVVDGVYDPGILDDCHTRGLRPPKSHWALPIDAPPYYAYPLKPGITFTYLGLKVNEEARVHFEAATAASNVFAAGEVMAGNILGKGYCAGTGMSIGGVFGRIAGASAAREADTG